jgi:hypothetical protein
MSRLLLSLTVILASSVTGFADAQDAERQPSRKAPGSISPNLAYRQYTDPAERAFTNMVPDGWRVGGRMVRYGPVTIAPFEQAMRPDGAVFIQLGDWHIKDYSDMPGWKPGSIYTPGTSVVLVRRVESPDEYARTYGLGLERWLGCSDARFTGAKKIPNPAGITAIPQARVETSEAHFTCTRGGESYLGQVTVTLQAYRLPLSTGWNVLYLTSILARKDAVETGFAALEKMCSTFRFLPEWSASQGAIARQATRPAQQALDSVLHQTQVFDQNVISGTITVNDPTTGSRSDVSFGAEPYYFSDGVGHFYRSYDPTPRSGFHAVQPQR